MNTNNNKPQPNDGEADFDYGDWVEFKLNTNLFGIVVGFDAMCLKYDVQLSPSGAVVPFFGVTLRALESSDEFEPPVEDEADAGVVIDFTRAKALRAGTKTQGAA